MDLKLGVWRDDISFNRKNSVMLSPRGIVFLDRLMQGFHAFWFKKANADDGDEFVLPGGGETSPDEDEKGELDLC